MENKERMEKILNEVLAESYKMPFNKKHLEYVSNLIKKDDIDSIDDVELKNRIRELLSVYFAEMRHNYKHNLKECNNDELICKMHEGDINALDELYEKNRNLIRYYAQKYCHLGVEIDDLIQEGSLAFIDCLRKYNPAKSAFSTYASNMIKYSILYYITNSSRSIRLPSYIRDTIKKLQKSLENLSVSDDYTPSDFELAERLGYSIEKYQVLQEAQLSIASLNSLSPDESSEFMNTVASDEPTPEEIFENDYSAEMEYLIENSYLSEKEKIILRMRFGFLDGKVHSLNEIAEIVGISSQGLDQKIQNILNKLRLNEYTDNLACYTDNPNGSLEYLRVLRNYTPSRVKKRIKNKAEKNNE